MEKFSKEFKRIMKALKKTLVYIHKRTSYLYTFIFLDIVWCYIRYGITHNEYRIFEFYEIDSSKRKTYMSRRKYKRLRRKLVDEEIVNVITDKELFLRRFKTYIKSEISDINDLSFKQFEDFALDNKKLLARSSNNSFISSFKRYDVSKFRSPAFVLEDIKDSKLDFVEKEINQHKTLDDISDLVIINVVTVFNYNNVDIVTASIKFKDKDNNKIISGNINVTKNMIKGHLKNEKGLTTGKNYDGLEIPYFDDIKKLCVYLASELEEIRQVEWSFAVGSRGALYLLDANIWTDYVFSQIPEFLNNRIGLMNYYKKI